jgi:hypothetical protein
MFISLSCVGLGDLESFDAYGRSRTALIRTVAPGTEGSGPVIGLVAAKRIGRLRRDHAAMIPAAQDA